MLKKFKGLKSRACSMAMLSSAAIGTAAYAGTMGPQETLYPVLFNQMYVGVFGGGGTVNDNNFQQRGTALYDPPLIVDAQAAPTPDPAWIIGAQGGYKLPEWHLGKGGSSLWSITPAAELEGYYLSVTETATLINPTDRIPEHTFVDTFPMNTGVFLANAVFVLNNSNKPRIHPYVGGGVGFSLVSISEATSTQINPAEPGVNHFDQNPNASNWTFAVQGKAGLQLDLNEHWKVFGEYRYLYLASTYYNFGATQYGTHIPTTNWTVNFQNLNTNLGSAGIKYQF